MWAEVKAAREPSQEGAQADALKTHQQQSPEQRTLRYAPSEKSDKCIKPLAATCEARASTPRPLLLLYAALS
jgi:hypothetical protein